jgi:hypothetical protein
MCGTYRYQSNFGRSTQGASVEDLGGPKISDRISNTAGSIELNAILFRFKTKEAAEEFKSKFETCQKEIPEKKPSAATVSVFLRIRIRGFFLLLNIFLPFLLISCVYISH